MATLRKRSEGMAAKIRIDVAAKYGVTTVTADVVKISRATDTRSVAIVTQDGGYAVATIDMTSYRARTANVWAIVGGSVSVDIAEAREIANAIWAGARRRAAN